MSSAPLDIILDDVFDAVRKAEVNLQRALQAWWKKADQECRLFSRKRGCNRCMSNDMENMTDDFMEDEDRQCNPSCCPVMRGDLG